MVVKEKMPIIYLQCTLCGHAITVMRMRTCLHERWADLRLQSPGLDRISVKGVQ